MKSVFSKKPQPDPELLALRAELQAAQTELACAYRQFNQAVDPELVESCVYQISAVKARCNYLLRAIKERTPEEAVIPEKTAQYARRRNSRKARPHSSAVPLPAAAAFCEADGEGAVWI